MNSENKQLEHFIEAYGFVPVSPDYGRQQQVMIEVYHQDVERLRQENRRLKRAIAILCIGGTITWLLTLLALLH